MATDRRGFFKGLAVASLAAVPAAKAVARERKRAADDAVGLLYDATKCIGCKTCTVACREANDLPADTHYYGNGLYDAPEGLNEDTKTVIALAKDGNEHSFVKKQCMHCIDPACVGACMLGALQKGKFGAVSYNVSKCVGCRYCEAVCPFNVPQFQWTKTTPKIVKCELCKERLEAGKQPACSEVCPRQAIIYGKYNDLLEEAHRRIAEAPPGTYIPKVYGEHEVGGTQVLFLSHMDFEKLGFRFNDTTAVPHLQQTVQHGIYKGFIGPVALYAVLGAVMFRNRGKENDNHEHEG
jgi:formate dehydrogenase beta subunit